MPVALVALAGTACGVAGVRARPEPGFVIAPPGRIGPVSIGEREAAVVAALGPGVVTRRDPLDQTTGTRYHERTYRARGLVVGFAVPRFGTGRVAGMRTTDPRYRTRSGVGVGSSQDQVESLGDVHCYDGRCQVGHMPATLFEIDGGWVTMVDLAGAAD